MLTYPPTLQPVRMLLAFNFVNVYTKPVPRCRAVTGVFQFHFHFSTSWLHFFITWSRTFTFELNVYDRVKVNEPPCHMYRSKVITFKTRCPDTTRPRALPEPFKLSVRITKRTEDKISPSREDSVPGSVGRQLRVTTHAVSECSFTFNCVFWTISTIKDEKSAAKFHYKKTLSGKVVAQSIAFRVVSIYWQG